MAERRRKKKKKKNKLAKLIKSLDFFKPRVPVPPTGSAFKSVKDYDRSNNKKIIDDGLDE